MIRLQYFMLCALSFTFQRAQCNYKGLISNPWSDGMESVVPIIVPGSRPWYWRLQPSEESLDIQEEDKVKVQDYYESQCSACRIFYTGDLMRAFKRFGDRLDIHGYPYGKANTTLHPDGTFDIECQHGPNECYGNQMQACVMDLLKNHTEAMLFNACLMDWSREDRGSNDNAADTCGKQMNVDSEAIKACAKSQKGKDLHRQNGEETKKTQFNLVPHVLINGVRHDFKKEFVQALCDAFKNKPTGC